MFVHDSVVMARHFSPNERYDVVDLDPYGTAAPFLDSAVHCVRDGGEREDSLAMAVRRCLPEHL